MKISGLLTEKFDPAKVYDDLESMDIKVLRLAAQGGEVMGAPGDVIDELNNRGLMVGDRITDKGKELIYYADRKENKQYRSVSSLDELSQKELQVLRTLVRRQRNGTIDTVKGKIPFKHINSLQRKFLVDRKGLPTKRGRSMVMHFLRQEGYVMEAEGEDRMAAIRRASQNVQSDNESEFENMSEVLDYADINKLRGMLRRKAGRRGASRGISDETQEQLQNYGLVNDNGVPTDKARQFMMWLDDPNKDNRTRSMKSKQFRQAADDSLTRGELKRTNTTPTSDDSGEAARFKSKALKLAKSLSDKGLENMVKVYNRFLNDRTQELAKNWAPLSEKAKESLRNLDILDDEDNITDYGEFALNYIRAFKDDPDGFERKIGGAAVGNRRRDPKKQKRNY